MGSSFDEYGRPEYDPARWPLAADAGSMKVYSDICAAHGLKFGLYWTRGVNAGAVNKTVKGTQYRVGDIVSNAKHANCPWGGGHTWLGVNTSHPAAAAYYDSLVELFADDWGAGFLKMDCIEFNQPDIALLKRAIAKRNNTMILSLSPGGKFQESWGQAIVDQQLASMYRVVNDFHGGFSEMLTNLDQAIRFAPLVGLNHSYPDLDMAPFGTGVRDGHADATGQQFYTTLYMIMRAPLLFGGQLPDRTGAVDLFQNHVALAVNARGGGDGAIEVLSGGNTTDSQRESVTMAAMLSSCPALDQTRSCRAYAVFNRLTKPVTVRVPLETRVTQRYDIWTAAVGSVTTSFTLNLTERSAGFFLIQ